MDYRVTCDFFLCSELLYFCEYIRVIGYFKYVSNLELTLMHLLFFEEILNYLFIDVGAESNMLINYWLDNDDWSFIAILVLLLLLLYMSNADMHLCWRIIINYRPGISFGAADMHIHYSWTSDPYDVRGVCLDCRYSWQFTIQSNVPTAFS